MLAVSFLIMFFVVTSAEHNCTTWHYQSGDQCVCGESPVVVCSNNDTQLGVGVLSSYCLTSNGVDSDISVVGRCLAVVNHGQRMLYEVKGYRKVWPNLTVQTIETCGYLNRQGRLCGQCKSNHYVSAYSYGIKCYECTSNVWINILKYICIAYLPLTFFLCVVVVFHISVTSPTMNVPVLMCQLFSLPLVLRYLSQYEDHLEYTIYIKVIATVYGIWNLDFFRAIVPPICLPLNSMQVIALDYLVAIYPLLLLVCVYILVTVHDRGCRLVVRLWRPFLWCITRLRHQWNVKHSIIDAFTTFYLLSYIKFLVTSANLLVTTSVYDEQGYFRGSYLYYDPAIQFLGSQHWPYAMVVLFVLLIGVLFPLLLLLFYPMMWFQRCLNKFGLNCLGLRIFMECFQGYYRDRTDGGWECRYFAVTYPTFVITCYILFSVTLSGVFFVGFILLCITLILLSVFIQPFRTSYKSYHKMNIFMIISLICVAASVIGSVIVTDESNVDHKSFYVLSGLWSLIPLFYFIFKIVMCFKQFFSHNQSCGRRNVFGVQHEEYQYLNEGPLN